MNSSRVLLTETTDNKENCEPPMTCEQMMLWCLMVLIKKRGRTIKELAAFVSLTEFSTLDQQALLETRKATQICFQSIFYDRLVRTGLVRIGVSKWFLTELGHRQLDRFSQTEMFDFCTVMSKVEGTRDGF